MTLRAVARLVRLPNLPTALADVALAALASSALSERGVAFVFDHWAAFVLLCAASAFSFTSADRVDVISVSTNPGATALTVMLRLAISCASDFVRPINPAFDAA